MQENHHMRYLFLKQHLFFAALKHAPLRNNLVTAQKCWSVGCVMSAILCPLRELMFLTAGGIYPSPSDSPSLRMKIIIVKRWMEYT